MGYDTPELEIAARIYEQMLRRLGVTALEWEQLPITERLALLVGHPVTDDDVRELWGY